MCLRALLFSALAVAIDYLDPLNLMSGADEYSSSLVYQLAPYESLPAETGPDPRIVVIVLTEEDLVDFEETWPANFWLHGEVVATLLDYRPKSIFIDIAFTHERQWQTGVGDFADLLARQEGWAETPEDIVPVFIASPFPERFDFGAVIEGLRDAATPVAVPGARYDRRSLVYPLIDRNGQIAAACAIYATVERPGLGGEKWCKAQAEALGDGEHFEIGWAVRRFDTLALGADGETRLADRNGQYECIEFTRCKNSPTCVLARFQEYMLGTFSQGSLTRNEALRTAPPPRLRQTCPPHRSYTVGQLLSGPALPQLAEQIAGAHVIYTAAVVGIDDIIEPPTHTPLRGSYFHSMALDNLIAFGEDFPRSSRKFLYLPVEYLGLALLAFPLILLSLRLSEHLGAVHERGGTLSDSAAVWRLYRYFALHVAFFILLALLLVTAVVVIEREVLKVSPVNYVGLFGLLALGFVGRATALIPPLRLGWGDWGTRESMHAKENGGDDGTDRKDA